MEPREVKLGEIVLLKLGKSHSVQYGQQVIGLGMTANSHEEGQVVPMVVTKIWSPNYVNGQALMDGPIPMWITSAKLGEGTHEFQFKD